MSFEMVTQLVVQFIGHVSPLVFVAVATATTIIAVINEHLRHRKSVSSARSRELELSIRSDPFDPRVGHLTVPMKGLDETARRELSQLVASAYIEVSRKHGVEPAMEQFWWDADDGRIVGSHQRRFDERGRSVGSPPKRFDERGGKLEALLENITNSSDAVVERAK